MKELIFRINRAWYKLTGQGDLYKVINQDVYYLSPPRKSTLPKMRGKIKRG